MMAWHRHGTALALVCAAALAGGCAESGGGDSCGTSAVLALGEASDESLAAGDCGSYEFTPEEDGEHFIYVTKISSGDSALLEFDADSYVCVDAGDGMTCAILRDLGNNQYENDLVADTDYDFTLTELSEENQTYTVEVTFGPK